nr:hypothetical protein [Oceanobacillus sp. CFH 90083]
MQKWSSQSLSFSKVTFFHQVKQLVLLKDVRLVIS